jgi:hypothetical protein
MARAVGPGGTEVAAVYAAESGSTAASGAATVSVRQRIRENPVQRTQRVRGFSHVAFVVKQRKSP